jgi:hypothetical protein
MAALYFFRNPLHCTLGHIPIASLILIGRKRATMDTSPEVVESYTVAKHVHQFGECYCLSIPHKSIDLRFISLAQSLHLFCPQLYSIPCLTDKDSCGAKPPRNPELNQAAYIVAVVGGRVQAVVGRRNEPFF